jgi:hypothetical protein
MGLDYIRIGLSFFYKEKIRVSGNLKDGYHEWTNQ